MDSRITFSEYDGKSDIVFNNSLFESLVLQYSEYTDSQHAFDLVCQFMPDKNVVNAFSEDGNARSIAAYLNSKVIGLASVSPIEQGGFLICQMEVMDSFRETGIGSALLNKVSQDKEPCSVYVSVHREYVKSFYAKNGFVDIEKKQLDLYGLEMDFRLMKRV